jgi:hypothetical protein
MEERRAAEYHIKGDIDENEKKIDANASEGIGKT